MCLLDMTSNMRCRGPGCEASAEGLLPILLAAMMTTLSFNVGCLCNSFLDLLSVVPCSFL